MYRGKGEEKKGRERKGEERSGVMTMAQSC